jgi:hypothetical protein
MPSPGTKNRVSKGTAIGGRKTRSTEELNLDAGDKKPGAGHMTVGVHMGHRKPKAAVKTAENSVRCPLVPEHRLRSR